MSDTPKPQTTFSWLLVQNYEIYPISKRCELRCSADKGEGFNTLSQHLSQSNNAGVAVYVELLRKSPEKISALRENLTGAFCPHIRAFSTNTKVHSPQL